MIMKFKVGDKVRCVSRSPTQYIQVGVVYTVQRVNGNGLGLEEIKLPHGYLDVQFELVQEAVLTPEEVFEHLRNGTKLQCSHKATANWCDHSGILNRIKVNELLDYAWRIKPEPPEPEVIELNGKKYIEITE